MFGRGGGGFRSYDIFIRFREHQLIVFSLAGDTQTHRVSTVVKVLCYKSEGRWFDPSWCRWIFSIDIKSFRSHYGPGEDSACNINEHQEYFLVVKAAGA